MKRWILGASAALLLLGTPAIVLANAAPMPPPSPLNKAPRSVKLIVEVDDSVKEPRLEIPQGLLLAPPGRPGRGVDAGPRMPFLVVGFALTASFVSGGLWLSRRGRNRTALLVTVALFALGSGALLADIARPKPKVTELALPAGLQLPPNVTLQVTEKGEAIKLVVPSGMVLKAEKPTPKTEPKRDE